MPATAQRQESLEEERPQAREGARSEMAAMQTSVASEGLAALPAIEESPRQRLPETLQTAPRSLVAIQEQRNDAGDRKRRYLVGALARLRLGASSHERLITGKVGGGGARLRRSGSQRLDEESSLYGCCLPVVVEHFIRGCPASLTSPGLDGSATGDNGSARQARGGSEGTFPVRRLGSSRRSLARVEGSAEQEDDCNNRQPRTN